MHLSMIYSATVLTAHAVVENGGSMDMAFRASQEGTMMSVIHSLKQARADGYCWAGEDDDADEEGPSLYHPDAFLPVDWRHLREKTGEPDWTPPEPIPGWRDEKMATEGETAEKSRLHR